jgi:hypothetical protein
MRSSIALVVAVGSLTIVGAGSAQTVHAIDFKKSCTSPVTIGDPYKCTVTVANTLDSAQDTVVVTGLSDTVHSAGGDVPSGSLLGAVQLVFGGTGSVSCMGGSGAGTDLNPYIGATSCSLAFGGTLTTKSFSHYVVQAADFGLPSHTLTDTASLTWHNTCTSPGDSCTTADQTQPALGSALVQQLSSTTTTQIHNSSHQVVTSVPVGTIVHDFVTVTGQPGQPFPTGNVMIERFANGGCSGTAASGTTVVLASDGTVDAILFTFTVSTPGQISFQATYLGDATYAGSTGSCETLTVPDPTAVQVASLQASRRSAGVLLRWRMGSEAGVLGYNVYRDRNGARTRLNRAIIAARGTVAGRSYSYLDRSAPRARHGLRYWLQVVRTEGSPVWKAVRVG